MIGVRRRALCNAVSKHDICYTLGIVVSLDNIARSKLQPSPDGKWPYSAKACFGVIVNFYD